MILTIYIDIVNIGDIDIAIDIEIGLKKILKLILIRVSISIYIDIGIEIEIGLKKILKLILTRVSISIYIDIGIDIEIGLKKY